MQEDKSIASVCIHVLMFELAVWYKYLRDLYASMKDGAPIFP